MKAPIRHGGAAFLLGLALAVSPARGGDVGRSQAAVVDSSVATGSVIASQKNPELAGALSVFLPGLGHIYAGESVKGAVLGGLFVAGIGAVIGSDIGSTHTSIRAGGWMSVSLVGAVYLFALIDAPFAARRANARAGDPHAHILRFESGRATVTVDVALSDRGAGALLTISL